MSILRDFEGIRNEMGHKKYDAIEEYLNEVCPESVIAEYEKALSEINNLEPDEWLKTKEELENKYNIVRLDDVLYKQKEFEKFDDWYQAKEKEGKEESQKKRKNKEREAR